MVAKSEVIVSALAWPGVAPVSEEVASGLNPCVLELWYPWWLGFHFSSQTFYLSSLYVFVVIKVTLLTHLTL